MSEDLVRRAMCGDREAFAVLAEGSIGRMDATARLILGDRDAAADAVQEALVSCWRSLPRLRDPRAFDGWLRRQLVNACTDELRSRARRARLRVPGEPLPDPATRVVAQDEMAGAFGQLATDHRVVLVLRYYLGLEAGEVAETLAVPIGTVRSRTHYALQALRAALDALARPSASRETDV